MAVVALFLHRRLGNDLQCVWNRAVYVENDLKSLGCTAGNLTYAMMFGSCRAGEVQFRDGKSWNKITRNVQQAPKSRHSTGFSASDSRGGRGGCLGRVCYTAAHVWEKYTAEKRTLILQKYSCLINVKCSSFLVTTLITSLTASKHTLMLFV